MKRLLLFLILSACPALHAALQLSLVPSLQSSARGAEIIFKGTLTNTSATERLFINDISFTLPGASAAQLSPGTNAFFANVPGILLPGESYSVGEVFHLKVNSAAPYGQYPGSVTILGGAAMTATTTLASTSFTVLVPDPASDGIDADNDGSPALLEYALNLNPQATDNAALPQAVMNASYLLLAFTPNAAAADVSFIVEGSSDLSTWSTGDVEEITPLADLPSGRRTYRYHPAGAASLGFLRLRVVR